MPILVRASSGIFSLEASGFPNEETLEKLLAENPDLLRPEDGSSLAFIARQVDLREAGVLDLLFVNDEGLPVAVEVKLARNGQSRREVVAQAIDYISALTALTNEELDQMVQGGLNQTT
jgi:RecB family endonuclease NucS